jgi:DNA-binding NarL/FixJ family response regulator
MVIDPTPQGREAVLQAIHFQKVVSRVTAYRSLEEALIAIRAEKKADIVFVSAMFPQRELGEFVGSAKQTKSGRDGAYILIFEDSVSRVALAKSLLQGTDGFVVAPFSANDMHNALLTAENVRQRNMQSRVETAVTQIIDVLSSEISFVARDRALGKKSSFKGSALDAADILRTFTEEEARVYFELLVPFLERLPAPLPFLTDRRTEVAEASDTNVESLIEGLKDPTGRVRAHAAKALGTLGKRAAPAIPYLSELLKDSNALCRHRAQQALEAIERSEKDEKSADEKLGQETPPPVRVTKR